MKFEDILLAIAVCSGVVITTFMAVFIYMVIDDMKFRRQVLEKRIEERHEVQRQLDFTPDENDWIDFRGQEINEPLDSN